MMSTRRSLLTFGALVAAVALLVPAGAQAQPTAPATAAAAAADYDTVVVTWTEENTVSNVMGYEIGYAATDATTAMAGTFDLLNPTKVSAASTARRMVINGLMPATRYVIAVRSTNPGDSDPTMRMSAWVLAPDVTSDEGSATTDPLPDPDAPKNVEVTALNGALMVTWDAVDDPIGIHHYKLKAAASGVEMTQGTDDGEATEHQIKGLTNGTEYSVTVQAVGMNPDGTIDADEDGSPDRGSALSTAVKGTPAADADDPDEDDTEAPALPLVGLGFLGAMLAGRGAWLRRRKA